MCVKFLVDLTLALGFMLGFLPVRMLWLIAEIRRPPATAPPIRHLKEREDKDARLFIELQGAQPSRRL